MIVYRVVKSGKDVRARKEGKKRKKKNVSAKWPPAWFEGKKQNPPSSSSALIPVLFLLNPSYPHLLLVLLKPNPSHPTPPPCLHPGSAFVCPSKPVSSHVYMTHRSFQNTHLYYLNFKNLTCNVKYEPKH
jgi:hypothetical protein